MRKLTLSLTAAFILLSSYTANAVLGKLNKGGKTVFTGTLIEVLEPGPATQIQTIITNITDASATKPYLIHLGPGVYDLGSTNIVMKEWVKIQGSGQGFTKITGAVSTGSDDATSAVLVGMDNTTLTDLTVENTGLNIYSMAIYNNGASPRIERVTAIATGGTVVFGVYNNSSSSPTMTNVTATGSGGANAYGVYNNSSSSPTMTNVTATGSGGASAYGVSNFSSSPIMTNVTATGSGSSNGYGVTIENASSSPIIKDSSLEGVTSGLLIDSDGTGASVANSRIVGGVNDLATGTQCIGNYDENNAGLTC